MKCPPYAALQVAAALALAGSAHADLPPLVASAIPPVSDPGADAGWSVAAGDVNGDGYEDAVLGVPHGDSGLLVDAGRVLVRFGPSFHGVQTLAAPVPSTPANFGYAVACGDLNHDGFADVLVGAPDENIGLLSDVGRAYVFLGPSLTSSVTLNMPVLATGADFGQAVAIGDVDGNGTNDALVGAPESPFAAATGGQVFVFSGGTFALLKTLSDPTPTAGAHFGWGIATGDVDGNGVADAVVGVRDGHAGAVLGAGRVAIFFGPALTATQSLTEPTPESGANFGETVAAGDVNGDGKADVVAGIPDGKALGINDSGEVAVFFTPGLTSAVVLREPTVELGADFGFAEGVGDVNGDGFADVIVGAQDATAGGEADAGEAWVFFGPSLATNQALVPNPIEGGADFGYAVATGDFNGDGLSDPLVAAKSGTPFGTFDEGQAFAFVWQTTFGVSSMKLSAAAGGTITMTLSGGAANGNRPYAVLGTILGDSPCLQIGASCVPIAFHPVVTTFLLTSGAVPGSIGTLNAAGNATAALGAPAGVAAVGVGLRFTFAWLTTDAFEVVSKPVVFEIVP